MLIFDSHEERDRWLIVMEDLLSTAQPVGSAPRALPLPERVRSPLSGSFGFLNKMMGSPTSNSSPSSYGQASSLDSKRSGRMSFGGRLPGQDSPGELNGIVSTTVVKQGYLSKRKKGYVQTSWTRCYFVLLGDRLTWAKNEQEYNSHPDHADCPSIPLYRESFVDMEKGKAFSFSVTPFLLSPDVIFLCGVDEDETRSWTMALHTVCQERPKHGYGIKISKTGLERPFVPISGGSNMENMLEDGSLLSVPLTGQPPLIPLNNPRNNP